MELRDSGGMGRMEELAVRRTKLYDWMRDLGLDVRELPEAAPEVTPEPLRPPGRGG